MTDERDHRHHLWLLRKAVRAVVREIWEAALMRRDEHAMCQALRREDWDGYARARIYCWHRWEQKEV